MSVCGTAMVSHRLVRIGFYHNSQKLLPHPAVSGRALKLFTLIGKNKVCLPTLHSKYTLEVEDQSPQRQYPSIPTLN